MQPEEHKTHDAQVRTKMRGMGVEPPTEETTLKRPRVKSRKGDKRHKIIGSGDGPFIRYTKPVRVAHQDQIHMNEVWLYVRRDGKPTVHEDYEILHRCTRCKWPIEVIDNRFDAKVRKKPVAAATDATPSAAGAPKVDIEVNPNPKRHTPAPEWL